MAELAVPANVEALGAREAGRRGHVLALVGIVATGIVGVAGAGASWLIAKEDRESAGFLARDERTHNRRLALDGRLFQHRASVYVDMLLAVDRQHTEVFDAFDDARPVKAVLFSDRTLELRLDALGSTKVSGAVRTLLVIMAPMRGHEPTVEQRALFDKQVGVIKATIRRDLGGD